MLVYNTSIHTINGDTMTFLLILSAVFTIFFLITCYVYRIAFYSPKGKRSSIDDPLQGAQYKAVSEHIHRISHIMEKIPCEDIWINSFDGCRLYGRYYHVRDGAPLEILFHGYRSCVFRDCSGGHALSRKMGFNSLAIDQRAHGRSDGITISFGIKECRDCLEWIQYANERFGKDTPIILSGLSMGAATVLMATAQKLPDNVACVMADSPYSTPSAILEKVCADQHYPVWLCRPFLHLAALSLGHFRLNGCSAKESVRAANIPILLIHGEDDLLVPCSMSWEIAACNPSLVTVHTFPSAGHGLSYLIDPIRYEQSVCDFLLTVPSVKNEISSEFLNRKYEI